MKKIFRTLAVTLLICVGVIMLDGNAVMAGLQTDEVPDSNGIKWIFNSGERTLTFTKTGAGTALPSRNSGTNPAWASYEYNHIVVGEGITEIGNYFFQNDSRITDIKFKDTIKSIGAYAFDGCNSLSSISFDNGFADNINIGTGAFNHCPSSGLIYVKDYNDNSITDDEMLQLIQLKNKLLEAGLSSLKDKISISKTDVDYWRISSARIYRPTVEITTDLDSGIVLQTSVESEIKPSVAPALATFKTVILTPFPNAENFSIRTDNGKYYLKGLKAGAAYLQVAAKDNPELTYTIRVTVSDNAPVLATGLQLDPTEVYVPLNGTSKIKATVLPENATAKSVTWRSQNADKVTVNGGEVKGIVPTGDEPVYVIATTSDGSYIESKCAVYVLDIVAKKITLDKSTMSLKVGESGDLTATVAPMEAQAYIDWSSDNTGVAMVDEKGHVVAAAAGTATITAAAKGNSDCKATCTVTVTDPNFNPNSLDPTKRFTDVPPGKWYSNLDGPIAYVIANGIMNGTGDGTTFEPESTCTREMFVQILYNSEGKPAHGSNNPFSDVQPQKWYTDAVIWAYENGVTSGTSATTFGIDGNVTREQIAQFLMNYAKKRGFDIEARADLSGFPDNDQISGWAQEAMSWANANGIINGQAKDGVNYLAPKRNAKRAEVAQMIKGFQLKFGK